ncbi:PIG-L family deacetylase [Streptomyces sp. NPDC047974]|uniref:PIG-L family deacetylase n=1 Tax=Streptomyces sp. NPDC047974 TaxID=3154343 RepID=UPI0033E7DCE9
MDRRSEAPRRSTSRRTVLAGLTGAALTGVLAGCANGTVPGFTGTTDATGGTTGSTTPVRRLGTERRASFGSTTGTRVMQIVAHPDDDLFFMNPDVAQTLTQGVPVVSVYVTDGGSFGHNAIPGLPEPPADIPAYVSSRQQGLRQAYASMLGAPLFTPWERTEILLPDGRRAELNRLEHQGRLAELVFLNIRMHTEQLGRLVNMTELWGTPGVRLPTQPGTGSPVQTSYSYNRAELIETLVSLLRRYRPTLVRTLDPDPDFQLHDAQHPRGSDQPNFSDHPDHTATALFTWRALADWAAGSARGIPVFQTEAYRGYYNQRWPYNLPPETVTQKVKTIDAYGGDPSWECGNEGGCGDYAVGGGRTLKSAKGWVRSTHRRYANAGPQVVRGDNGGITVFGVLGTRLARWTSHPATGKLGDPEDLGGGPLAPAISVTKGPDGRLMVFALRFARLEGAVTNNVREIVVLRQKTPGGAFESAWTSLGNPETTGRRTRLVGTPTAVTGRDGRVHLFVRNGNKGVSTRVLTNGTQWSPWRPLPGARVQEALTATVDGKGLIHLFAASSGWIEHWTQRGPTSGLRKGSRRLVARPGDVPNAVTASDGSVLVAYRGVSSGGLRVERLAAGAPKSWATVAYVNLPAYGRVSLVGGRRPNADQLLMAVSGGTGEGLVYDVHGREALGLHTRDTAVSVGVPATLTAPGSTIVVATGLNAAPIVSHLQQA